jgi:hypothetical protein
LQVVALIAAISTYDGSNPLTTPVTTHMALLGLCGNAPKSLQQISKADIAPRDIAKFKQLLTIKLSALKDCPTVGVAVSNAWLILSFCSYAQTSERQRVQPSIEKSKRVLALALTWLLAK